MATAPLPTWFISHGGGPWPWIKDLMPGNWEPLEVSLRDMARQSGNDLRAVLMVSGHWEAPSFTVQTHPNPPMLYDYGGFPDFTYHLSYPAPGAPEVAAQVADRLEAAGLPTATDPHRGFDHGTFVPMAVAWPDAEVPTLSSRSSGATTPPPIWRSAGRWPPTPPGSADSGQRTHLPQPG